MIVLWLAIAVLVLVAVAWTVTLLAGLSLWIPILFTIVAVFAFGAFLLFRWLRARARARALERELLRQAAHQAEHARPDRRAEILELQGQMKAAIDMLKRTKLGGRGGPSALYALPWYVIIGPPAAGKTTALEKSGLQFTTPPGSSGPKVRGTAGTRNCDWWFARNAILLDTAGRFATHEDDQQEWHAFLDVVRRFRPDRPLEGLVVAVSVDELLRANDMQIDELAQKLRARVDEVMGRLEMVLPIYVLFTKADLVAGFVEFWGDLGKPQRAQAWGATFALDDQRIKEPARAFEAEFDLLVGVLHARMLERLSREQLAEMRAKILQYPTEFQGLKQPLARFIEELCKHDPYSDTPILRGFYFSSGTQTGRPLDRVLANMVRGFDLRLAPAATPVAQPQSYFVTELFERIIFPDRHLAVRSTSRLRRYARRQAIICGAVVLLTLLILVPAMVSYAKDRDLIQATAQDLTEAARLDKTGESGGAADALLQRVQTLEEKADQFRIPGWWGLQSAPQLLLPVRAVYFARLRSIVEGAPKEQLVANVKTIGTLVRTDAENFRTSYDDLKLYLMLTEPEHLQVDWATEKLASIWATAARSPATDQQKLKLHSRYYLSAFAADKSWAWPSDATIVTQAQGRLVSQPLDELRYGWVIDKAKDVPPIRPEKIFFGPSTEFASARENVQVPGLYTEAGWQKVRSALASPDAQIDIEPWVLGQTQAKEEPGASADRLRELYFQKYARAWLDFLGGLDIKAPDDMETAIRELRVLTEADGPYVRLFRTLQQNVALQLDAATLADKAADKAKEVVAKVKQQDAAPPERTVSSVEKRFQPLLKFAFGDSKGDAQGGKGDSPPSGLNQYLSQLSNLEVSLSQLAESKTAPTTESASELSRTASAVQRLLAGLDSSTRVLIEPLLMNPIRGSRTGVSKAGGAALSDRWRTEVWETYNSTLAGRFPFADVEAEASIGEFADFFRPQTGILWRYFDTNLKDRLEHSGNSFVAKNAADPIAFRADFLQCLARAYEITDALFGTAPNPDVPFYVNVQPAGSNIAEITLNVDGSAVTYRNEPERWQPLQWPGKGPQRGAIVRVKGAGFGDEISRQGDFGLFRLLAAGGVKSQQQGGGAATIFTATWSLKSAGNPAVTIQFKPNKSKHPFARDFFRSMKCPAEIVTEAAGPGR